ncbi:MAG: hypothetical protein G3M70_01985 [Candidatus Nitronauta litoralis]|uniref:Catalase n=1 Tax=Candidatus Nitronauta litoralis TaxID=2705533 RepID=A0A7T0FZB8_9BACT|nr:MAG: hypothetical protein G3M70_01985 [Candidatus Nitronauta litoralis]
MFNKTIKMFFSVFVGLAVIGLSSGWAAAELYSHKIKPTRHETVAAGEEENIKKIVEAQGVLQGLRYKDKKKLRNVHPKAHGCVNAVFIINKDIKKEYQVGLFSRPGVAYPNVKIRFSNATTVVNPDLDPATGANRSRGMAIQIPNVEKITRQKVIQVPNHKGTQDFLMINQPVFAIKNIEDYLEITNFQIEELKGNAVNPVKRFVTKGLPENSKLRGRERQIVGSIVKAKMESPFDAQYFSASPFLLGPDKVMKFSAKPKQCRKSPDYLREAMRNQFGLNTGKRVCFDFLLQVPTDQKDLGIEDATFEWIEDKSLIGEFPGKMKKGVPYEKVAEIVIPVQNFDKPAANTACEELEFNPWHSLEAHQPLGGINRLRNPVYLESARGRK